MYSSNYYRSSTSPYRAPSKSANSFDYGRYRSNNTHNTDFGNETWPLDEVIDKIDLKSESDYHDEPCTHNNRTLPVNHRDNPINTSVYSFSEPYHNRSNSPRKSSSRFERVGSPDPDMVYSAFPDRTNSWMNFNSGNYNKHNNSYESYKHKDIGYKPYDSNNNINNYISDDQWLLNDYNKGPIVRDVAIQCNLKKYQQSLHAAIHEPSVERVITQKPPIKVIKSSPSGVVSTFSSVPKLSSTVGNTRPLPYSELDFDSYEPSPQNDIIYTQVDKKPSNRISSSSKLNSSINSNLNVVFKAPVNDSILSNNSSRLLSNDSKHYDVRSKEYGFSVNTPAMSRVNLNSYDSRHMSNSSHELGQTEKEILEETISISNASEESYRLSKNLRNFPRDRDDLSYTGMSVTSGNSSNYRQTSPTRYERFTSKIQPSPFGTIEKNRDTKTKIKKKKSSRKIDPENVLLSNNSLRLKSSKHGIPSDRLYKSNADLRDSYLIADETRGGLAAAYKQRQQMARTPPSDRQRALSLSRMSSAFDDHDDHRSSSIQPSRHMSHLQLGGRGSRLSDSSTGTFQRTSSRSQFHERDPIVMYIPTANRESPVKQGILRNNSTKGSAPSTLPSKGKKASESRKSKDTERIKQPSNRTNVREIEKEETKKSKNTKEKKSSKKQAQTNLTSASVVDLNRSQSMPKDTKFNWLSKLKLKSK